jgi:hypothetical protein
MNDHQQSTEIRALRQSRCGVVSLASSIVAALMVVGVFPLMSFLDKNEIEVPEPMQSIGALFMPLAALLSLVAIVTGMIGLLSKDRRRGFAIAGLATGTCTIALLMVIVILVLVIMPSH